MEEKFELIFSDELSIKDKNAISNIITSTKKEEFSHLIANLLESQDFKKLFRLEETLCGYLNLISLHEGQSIRELEEKFFKTDDEIKSDIEKEIATALKFSASDSNQLDKDVLKEIKKESLFSRLYKSHKKILKSKNKEKDVLFVLRLVALAKIKDTYKARYKKICKTTLQQHGITA